MNQPSQPPVERTPLDMRDVPERSRYEATTVGDDPTLAGVIEYERSSASLVLRHTEVLEGFDGQGVGSQLVRVVMADARQHGLRVVPECAFVVRWLEKHPEQQDILAEPLAAPGKSPSKRAP